MEKGSVWEKMGCVRYRETAVSTGASDSGRHRYCLELHRESLVVVVVLCIRLHLCVAVLLVLALHALGVLSRSSCASKGWPLALRYSLSTTLLSLCTPMRSHGLERQIRDTSATRCEEDICASDGKNGRVWSGRIMLLFFSRYARVAFVDATGDALSDWWKGHWCEVKRSGPMWLRNRCYPEF